MTARTDNAAYNALMQMFPVPAEPTDIVREWMVDDEVFRELADGTFECVSREHDGYVWADRCTGRGLTVARAQYDLHMNVLPDWYDGGM